MEYVDLTNTEPAQGRAIAQRGVDRGPGHDTEATCVAGPNSSDSMGTGDSAASSTTAEATTVTCSGTASDG